MGDIAKGILGGGWSLVAGWIVPTALNVLVFAFFVRPDLDDAVPLTDELGPAAAVLTAAAAVIGLVLNALQRLLYRPLEGYLGWPGWAFRWARGRQLRRRHRLREQVADDQRRTAAQRGALRERLRRFPLDDEQVLPTSLGNAIRRIEEYGYSRYRLDSQVFWYELEAVVGDQARQQVDQARVGVDFFVCLLYGHVLVAGAAAAAGRPLVAAVLVALTPVWYSLATQSTDGWAAAVRAMVNLGRRPLAESVGLGLPDTLAEEREMWSLLSKLTRLSYHEKAAGLDAFRKRHAPIEQG